MSIHCHQQQQQLYITDMLYILRGNEFLALYFSHCPSQGEEAGGSQAGLGSVLGRQEQTQQADCEERAQSDFP